MTLLSPASVVLPFADKLGTSYRSSDDAARLTALSGLAASLAAPANDDILAFIETVSEGIKATEALGAPDKITYGVISPVMQDLSNALASNGGALYSSIKTYADYNNGLTPFSCLYSPNFAILYWIWVTQGRRTPTALLPAGDVFAPVTALGTATIGAAGAVTFTPGGTIPTTTVTTGGGTQGYAPAKGAIITGTTLVNGTETLSITYNGQSAAGVPFTGHTGTVAIDNLAVSGTVTFTPPSSERISHITAIAVTGSPSATAGAFSVASQIER